MAGQMGSERKTTQSLEVIRVDAKNNLLLIKGAVPGATGASVVFVQQSRLRGKSHGTSTCPAAKRRAIRFHYLTRLLVASITSTRTSIRGDLLAGARQVLLSKNPFGSARRRAQTLAPKGTGRALRHYPQPHMALRRSYALPDRKISVRS